MNTFAWNFVWIKNLRNNQLLSSTIQTLRGQNRKWKFHNIKAKPKWKSTIKNLQKSERSRWQKLVFTKYNRNSWMPNRNRLKLIKLGTYLPLLVLSFILYTSVCNNYLVCLHLITISCQIILIYVISCTVYCELYP